MGAADRAGPAACVRIKPTTHRTPAKSMDHKTLALITAAITAYVAAEQTQDYTADWGDQTGRWARYGRTHLMQQGAQMQQRPTMGRRWSTWAL